MNWIYFPRVYFCICLLSIKCADSFRSTCNGKSVKSACERMQKSICIQYCESPSMVPHHQDESTLGVQTSSSQMSMYTLALEFPRSVLLPIVEFGDCALMFGHGSVLVRRPSLMIKRGKKPIKRLSSSSTSESRCPVRVRSIQ